MARVTPQTSAPSDFAWEEDTWYGVTLREWSIEEKGVPGYKGQPTKHPRLACTWALNTSPDDWIMDWLNLTVRPQKDGTHAKAKLLICALAGRDPRQESTPWVDDETLEYGFDADAQVVAGRITTGCAVAVKGHIVNDKDGNDRLRVDRYGAAHLGSPQQVSGPTLATPAAASPAPADQLSPDGRYRWDGADWQPVAAAVPPLSPTPNMGAAAVPAPQQDELL